MPGSTQSGPMSPVSRSPARGSARFRWFIAVLVGAICWFHFWTAFPERPTYFAARTPENYYNELAAGFLKGHLWLDVPGDPYLDALADPWNPAERKGHDGLPDTSYYRGHYYIYFGVTPTVLVFLPFRILTGWFLSDSLANVLFVGVGFLTATWIVLTIRRRHFPAASAVLATLCVVAVGLTPLCDLVLRRPSFREIPVTCGYACCMVGLAAFYGALGARRPALSLTLASAALALAVGSRPLYLLVCPLVLVPLWLEARASGGSTPCWRRRPWWRLVGAGVLPMALIGGGLALYNFLRFGRVTEFGLRYQFWGDDPLTTVRLAWRFAPYNLRAYWLAAARWSRYFPFVSVAGLPAVPAGFTSPEDPYGIVANVPFTLLALGTLGLAGGKLGAREPRLAAFCGAVAWAGLAMAGVMLFFQAALIRYMLDFTPAMVLLACLGLLVLSGRRWFHGWKGTAATGGAALLCLYSALFNVLASQRHNELFRAEHPGIYQRIAHRWDYLPAFLDRVTGAKYGPIEMTVHFPSARVGTVESLVITGEGFLCDYLFVHYLGADSIRFGLVHTSVGSYVGKAVHCDRSKDHVIRVEMGSLYPPAAAPYFDGMPRGEARRRQTTVSVTLDGEVVFYRLVYLYDAVSPRPVLGPDAPQNGVFARFSGTLSSVRRLSDGPGAGTVRPAAGAYHLRLRLPPFTGARGEPLVCAGETGRGDLVYVRYLTADRVLFGFDHWGRAGAISGEVKVDPASEQDVEIDWGALHPDAFGAAADEPKDGVPGRIQVTLNHRPVLDAPVFYYLADPSSLALGLNPIGSSTAGPSFTGEIVSSRRGPSR